MSGLHDKIVVITGAGSGIGRHLAIAFAERSAIGILTDSNAQTLAETVDLILRKERVKEYSIDFFTEQ